MSFHLSLRVQDLAIRATGLILASAGALAIATLYRVAHTARAHDTNLAEVSYAALGFIGLSLGSCLLALSSHIFDQVEVSPRWARRCGPVPRDLWIAPDERFVHAMDASRALHLPIALIAVGEAR